MKRVIELLGREPRITAISVAALLVLIGIATLSRSVGWTLIAAGFALIAISEHRDFPLS